MPMLDLSESAFVVDYLAEGAANVVFRLQARQEVDTIYEGKLLRLRKDLPTSTGILQSQRDFERCVIPLFAPDELVEQILVQLPAGWIDRCNNALKALEREGTRPLKRHGVYLRVQEEHGLLVTDMSSRSPRETTIEFKPKWLAQSPSAPPRAVRCRTCALAAKRTAGRKDSDGICPLDLFSGNRREICSLLERVTATVANTDAAGNAVYDLAAEFLVHSPLLKRLRQLQTELDPHGVTHAGPSEVDEERLRLAMTLRDCTLYLRLRDRSIEARLGDLDLKSPSKTGVWRDTERMLIDEGWYGGKETGKRDEVGLRRCALE